MTTFRHKFIEVCDSDPHAKWLCLLRGQAWESFNYQKLHDRVSDYCAFYEDQKLKGGDTVLIILQESLDLFASFFAGIAYGVLPAYSAYPSPKQSPELFLESVENLLRYNEIRMVIGYSEVVELLKEKNSINTNKFRGYFTAEEVEVGRRFQIRNIEPGDEAFLQFSSGTTGAKKGVRISVQALFNQTDAYRPHLGFNAFSRVVSWLPHYHDMGLVSCMLIPFLEKVPISMMSPFEWVKNPELLLKAVTDHRGTHIWLPNFALDYLSRNVPDDHLIRYDLSSLDLLTVCSEPVQHATVKRFADKFHYCGLEQNAIVNCYAMAENTFAVTSSKAGEMQVLKVDRSELHKGRIEVSDTGAPIISAGKPLDNSEIRIVNEIGEVLPEDTEGEITLRTDCMLDGYHNNPEATAGVLKEGWYSTGDLGFLHADELYVTGRAKDMIIVGGENIYPQDVEAILDQDNRLIPGRNVVFGVKDERIGTERIIALAEAKTEFLNEKTEEMRKKIWNLLNVSLSEIILLEHRTLIKGTAGKISRRLNKQNYLNWKKTEESDVMQEEGLLSVVKSVLPKSARASLTRETPLLTSGLIDSFGFIEMILAVEDHIQKILPEECRTVDQMDTVAMIEKIVSGNHNTSVDKEKIQAKRDVSLRSLEELTPVASRPPFWEWLINAMPIRTSYSYKVLLRLAGIKIGRNVTFAGRVHVKLRGKNSNIIIGDNVFLGDNVDLRNRENGSIILGCRTMLDTNVRVVAAREGFVKTDYGAEIGANSVINSGGQTCIGKFAMIASNVQINASSHSIVRDCFVKGQPHKHGTVCIGDDVWIGSGVSVVMNTEIGEGAVVSSNSVVSGNIPAFSVCIGIPAKVIKYRS